MNSLLLSIVQGVLVLALAPGVTGFVRMCKARLQDRRGASPLLPYYRYATLFKKQMVISTAASWVFHVAPFVVLTVASLLAFLLPLLSTDTGGLANFILVAGLLLLAASFLVLGGLDPGSAFGGMGASREMTIAVLLEPTIFLVFAPFALLTQHSDIQGMLAVGGSALFSHPQLFLSIIALLLVALAENKRYPVDNPATHLELTMVHEAMILEYSGTYLAMMEYAASLNLTVFALLAGSFIMPLTLSGAGFLGCIWVIVLTVLKLIVAMALLALLETSIPKMRLYRMQEFLSLSFVIALGGFLLTLTSFS